MAKQILIRVDDDVVRQIEEVKKMLKEQGYPVPSVPKLTKTALEWYLKNMIERKGRL